MKAKIYIIDDDEKLGKRLKKYLKKFDYKIFAYSHPKDGLEAVQNSLPDLIILDVMMPDMDGFEVLKKIHADEEIPVIMLTARGDVTDKVVGLELGADDYLAKPFDPRELLARIQTVLRRVKKSSDKVSKEIEEFDDLKIDFGKHAASISGEDVSLTHLEFELLKTFVENRGRVLDRNYLLEKLKDSSWKTFDRSIDDLVSRLRKKLQDDPQNPKYIKTIRGTGYMFIKGV